MCDLERELRAGSEREVALLDLRLHHELNICRALRESGYDGAIIIVTAHTGELDRVVGLLDSGADELPLTKTLRAGRAVGPGAGPATPDAARRRWGRSATTTRCGSTSRRRRVYAGEPRWEPTSKEFDVLARAGGPPRQGAVCRAVG